jgi:hypothetical protein
MKKKLFLLPVFIFIITSICSSQDLLSYNTEKIATEKDSSVGKSSPSFEFRAYSKDSYLNNISSDLAGKHLLGDLIAKKIYLFNKFYTSEENLFPGNPATKTVIKKPVIYESVRQIERDLKKSLKKEEISTDEAASIMNTVLDIALNIQTEDTKAFENALKNSNNSKSKIVLYTKKVKLNY